MKTPEETAKVTVVELGDVETTQSLDQHQRLNDFLQDLQSLLRTKHPNVSIVISQINQINQDEKSPLLYLSLISSKYEPEGDLLELQLVYSIIKILELKYGLFIYSSDHSVANQLDLKITTLESGLDLNIFQPRDHEDEKIPEVCGEKYIPIVLRQFVNKSIEDIKKQTKRYFQFFISHQNNQDNISLYAVIADLIEAVELEIKLMESGRNQTNTISQNSDEFADTNMETEDKGTLRWRAERYLKLLRAISSTMKTWGGQWGVEITMEKDDSKVLEDYIDSLEENIESTMKIRQGWTVSEIHNFDRRLSNGEIKSYCSVKIVFITDGSEFSK